jgi:signal transduction histidine kinase
MTLFRKKTGNLGMKDDFPEGPDSRPNETDLLKRPMAAINDYILIGKLTPEVVHDINNFLTGILGYAELLSMKPIQDQSLKNGLQNIYISADKCKELLSHLIGLIRPERVMPAQGNINESVEKTILLRNCAFRHKQITVNKSLNIDLPGIPIQDSKLEKALLALIFYAEEVLEQKAKDRKINFETTFKGSNEVLIRMDVFASAGAYTALLKSMEADSAPQKDLSTFGVGPREARDWIAAMGGSLEVEKIGEGGFRFLILFPLKP